MLITVMFSAWRRIERNMACVPSILGTLPQWCVCVESTTKTPEKVFIENLKNGVVTIKTRATVSSVPENGLHQLPTVTHVTQVAGVTVPSTST